MNEPVQDTSVGLGIDDGGAGASRPTPGDRASARRSPFIRGARNGGSPFLNFFFALAMTLGVVVLAAAGYGIYRGVDYLMHRERAAGPENNAAQASTAQSGVPTLTEVRCRSGRVARRETIPGIQSAAAVAMGTAAFPRDPETIESVRGQTGYLPGSGDRVDVFVPDGAKLAVQYVGQTAVVRSVAVSFESPRPVCSALILVGLIDSRATLALRPDGVIQVVNGARSSPLTSGELTAVVRFKDDNVSVLQINRNPS